MNPKSGKPPRAVLPVAPSLAMDADIADPGAVAASKAEQAGTGAGKYGTVETEPHKPAETDESETQTESGWIEIELVGEDDEPIPGEKYEITLPDGKTVAEGTLDDHGWARVEGVEDGTCTVTFTELDQDAWEAIDSVGPRGEA